MIFPEHWAVAVRQFIHRWLGRIQFIGKGYKSDKFVTIYEYYVPSGITATALMNFEHDPSIEILRVTHDTITYRYKQSTPTK